MMWFLLSETALRRLVSDFFVFHGIFRNFAVFMKTSVIIRFLLLGIAWLALVLAILLRTPKITLYTIFVIFASAVIVFVPVYKKYVKNGRN